MGGWKRANDGNKRRMKSSRAAEQQSRQKNDSARKRRVDQRSMDGVDATSKKQRKQVQVVNRVESSRRLATTAANKSGQ